MFSKKEKQNANNGPYRVSGSLARLIGEEWGKIPQSGDHWVQYLAVSRPRSDLILMEGWCDQKSKSGSIKAKAA